MDVGKLVQVQLRMFILVFRRIMRAMQPARTPRRTSRRLIWKHGRRLRGPELVTTAEFNEKLGRSQGLTKYAPDGVMFVNEERTWANKLFRKNWSRWARVLRDREAMHFLIVGDSGTGKSAAIRQILSQV